MTAAYIRTTSEILKEFNIAPDTRLNSAQVIHRREQSGPNSLTYAMRKSLWDIPASLTSNVIVYLFAAGCRGQPDALLLGPAVHFLRRY